MYNKQFSTYTYVRNPETGEIERVSMYSLKQTKSFNWNNKLNRFERPNKLAIGVRMSKKERRRNRR